MFMFAKIISARAHLMQQVQHGGIDVEAGTTAEPAVLRRSPSTDGKGTVTSIASSHTTIPTAHAPTRYQSSFSEDKKEDVCVIEHIEDVPFAEGGI